MKSKVVLSIVVSSFAGLLISEQATAAELPTQTPAKVAHKAEKSSGKCASGKCGTEKIYGQAKLNHNPQDKLTLARDGKCGTSGFGLNPTEKELTTKMVGGVCGQ